MSIHDRTMTPPWGQTDPALRVVRLWPPGDSPQLAHAASMGSAAVHHLATKDEQRGVSGSWR